MYWTTKKKLGKGSEEGEWWKNEQKIERTEINTENMSKKHICVQLEKKKTKCEHVFLGIFRIQFHFPII